MSGLKRADEQCDRCGGFLRLYLVLLGAIVIVPAFAGTVSAHHSNISASVACSGTVSWTASSWATGAAGTNTDIRVTKTCQRHHHLGCQWRVQPRQQLPVLGHFCLAGRRHQRDGHLEAARHVGQRHRVARRAAPRRSASRPTAPASRACSKAVSCVNTSPGHGEGRVVVTLSNNAGLFASAVVFKVYNPDQTTTLTNYTVATGASTPVTFTGLSDGSHFVKILVGAADHSSDIHRRLRLSNLPSVTSSSSCVNGDGQVVVTLQEHRRRSRDVHCHQSHELARSST